MYLFPFHCNLSIPITETFAIYYKLLKKLNEEAKQEIFEKVFLEEDTIPLTAEEKQEIIKLAEQELKNRETISWPFGK